MLRNERETKLRDKDKIKKEFDLYVELFHEDGDKMKLLTLTITEKIESFSLDSNQRFILIRGVVGSGKSLFLQKIEKQYWDIYEKGKLIPLFIPLPSLQEATSDILYQFFQSFGATDEVISINFLFFFFSFYSSSHFFLNNMNK